MPSNWLKENQHLPANEIEYNSQKTYQPSRLRKTYQKEQTKSRQPDNFGIRPTDASSPQQFQEDLELISFVGKVTIHPINEQVAVWKDLVPKLKENLGKLNFQRFSIVQRYLIALMQLNSINRAYQSVVLSAPPCSGKTLAYLIPTINYCDAINEFLENEDEPYTKHYPRVLVICNNSDGASAIYMTAKKLSSGTNTIVCSAIGTFSCNEEKTFINTKGVDVVIGTMGRIRGFLEDKTIDISQLDTLILDDGQRFAANKDWRPTVKALLPKLPKGVKTICITSAIDIEPLKEVLQDLVEIRRCCLIDFRPSSFYPCFPHFHQEVLQCAKRNRYKKCLEILLFHRVEDRYPKTLIFVDNHDQAEFLATYLRCHDGISKPKVSSYHHYTPSNDRNILLTKFINGFNNDDEEIDVLVSTDILSTNIKTKAQIIINFDIPLSLNLYMDRIGRMPRHMEGYVYTFVDLINVDENRLKWGDLAMILYGMEEMGAELPALASYFTLPRQNYFYDD